MKYGIIAAILFVGAVLGFVAANELNTAPQTMEGFEEGIEDASDANYDVVISELAPYNDSAQSGEVVINETIVDNTDVRIALRGETDSERPQAAGIYSGTCENPGEVLFELNDVANGTSLTTLDVMVEEIRDAAPESVVAVSATDELNDQVYACGPLTL